MSDLFLALATMTVHESVVGVPIETITSYDYTDGAVWFSNANGDFVILTMDDFDVHCPAGPWSYGFFDINLHAHHLMTSIRRAGRDYTLDVWTVRTWGNADEDRCVLMLVVHVLEDANESAERHVFPIGLFEQTPPDLEELLRASRAVLLG